MLHRESQSTVFDDEEEDHDEVLHYEPVKKQSKRVSYAPRYEEFDEGLEHDMKRRSRGVTREDRPSRSHSIKHFDRDNVLPDDDARNDDTTESSADPERTLVYNWDENEHTLISALLHTES